MRQSVLNGVSQLKGRLRTMTEQTASRIAVLIETLRVNALGASDPNEPVIAHRSTLTELLNLLEDTARKQAPQKKMPWKENLPRH